MKRWFHQFTRKHRESSRALDSHCSAAFYKMERGQQEQAEAILEYASRMYDEHCGVKHGD